MQFCVCNLVCYVLQDVNQKGRSSKKNKKKKRTKTLTKELTLTQAYQQMFCGYYKVIKYFLVLDVKLQSLE